MIEMTCPGCGQQLKIAEQFAGQKGKCGFCKGAILVSALDVQNGTPDVQPSTQERPYLIKRNPVLAVVIPLVCFAGLA